MGIIRRLDGKRGSDRGYETGTPRLRTPLETGRFRATGKPSGAGKRTLLVSDYGEPSPTARTARGSAAILMPARTVQQCVLALQSQSRQPASANRLSQMAACCST